MTTVLFEIPLFVTRERNGTADAVPPTKSIAELIADEINDVQLQDYSDGAISTYAATAKDRQVFIEASSDVWTPAEIINYFDGQMSDGWGEGFEQTPIPAHIERRYGGDLYVSTWAQGWRESHPAISQINTIG